MRKALDTLYAGSGALAALFLVFICVIVLLQVGANAIGKVAEWITGTPLGLVVPSYADFTGYFLAASSFLALAYTLRHGGHIRVSLLIQGAGRRARWVVELWCLSLGAIAAGYFAWWAINLVMESLEYGDVSAGMVPVPLWIPQSGMALGLVILCIAMVDDLVRTLRGGMPSYEHASADLADSFEDAPTDEMNASKPPRG
ncbi:TRAP dicarboxylate transporter, DctQ subunit [Caenispirillum salinarum AK4]|uniref:TRAP transporter small permease protein n=1 Tax=Caenispirillum salinarum AK4 TaxID=1238182 RepID=K9HU83_9PROT|nr:TRAP transporter small permease [Caenispirillum salinarum]EKV31811.1 TRAP dicarboxylate transporter, DctQ subunit [Caenispirillum salinarum AK4]